MPWLLIGSTTPNDDDYLLILLSSAVHSMTLNCIMHMCGFHCCLIFRDVTLLFTFNSLCQHVFTWVVWDLIICGSCATQVPTEQRGHTSSYCQGRLWDTIPHPEFYQTLPREALKICHAWQQPYISCGSLCYVSCIVWLFFSLWFIRFYLFFSFKWSCKMSNTNYSARLIKPSFCRRKQKRLV